MTPDERKAALELEFERLKERADILDRFLQGHPDAWINIRTILQDAQHIGSIELDKPVAEARQTALAMATVLKALTAMSEPEVEKPADDPLQKMEDEVARKRAEKSA